jgi:sodium/bile acid cotransporter 7
MPPPEAIASGIMASQKSAPVAVTVMTNVTNDLTQQGLLAIPAIVSQLAQIFIDSAFVTPLSRRVTAWEDAQANTTVDVADMEAVTVPDAAAGRESALAGSSTAIR